MDGWKEGKTEGWMEGRKESGRADEWMEGWMGGPPFLPQYGMGVRYSRGFTTDNI